MMYFPLYEGDAFREASLVVRVHNNPLSLAFPIQKMIARMDPNLAVADILTLDQVIGKSTAEASFDTALIGWFAVLSLLLAAIGLYGVLSYIVTQRTGELGIRIALGARRLELIRLALFDGMRPAVIGLVVGLLTGLAAAQTVRSMLFGVKTTDATILFIVPAVLLMVAAVACAVPAWRASSVDPIVALRTE